MKREELERIVKDKAYMPGGTKEACVKVRDFMVNFYKYMHESEKGTLPPGNAQLIFPESCVTIEEYIEAVRVLMAAAFLKKDEVPERWSCDSDCKYTCWLFCFGQFNLTNNEQAKLCPFFVEETDV